MYKEATRKRLRFNTSKGVVSVEQLWQFSTAELITVIKDLNKLIGETTSQLDFIDAVTVQDDNQLRFDIAKDIYLTRKTEREAATAKQDAKEYNQKILEHIAEKEKSILASKSMDELKAMLK